MPQALRVILEKALSEDASQENLDRYLPSIRDIIVTLLRQLKQKQMLIRSQAHAAPPPPGQHPILQRNFSGSTQLHPSTPPPPPAVFDQPAQYTPTPPQQAFPNPAQARQKPAASPLGAAQRYPARPGDANTPANGAAQPSRSPSQPYRPHPTDTKPPYAHHVRNKSSLTGSRADLDHVSHKDPLAALQRGEALERRASRRFSAYQFAKLANGAGSRTDIPDLPLLPGGGAGMGISGSRGPPAHHVHHPSNIPGGAGHFLPTKTPRSAHAAEYTASTMLVSNSSELPAPQDGAPGSSLAAARAALSGASESPDTSNNTQVTATRSKSAPATGKERPLSLIQQQHQFAQEQGAPEPAKPAADATKLVLFLQIARSVKKCVIDKSDLTIPALRLLFVDKFAYPMSADAIPALYIQDPTSGIRYELDEDGLANDVHQGSLISLNVEAVDQVKKHIDEGFATLTKQMTEIGNKVAAHGVSIQKITEMQEMQKPTNRASGSELLKKASFGSKPRQHSVSAASSRTNSINLPMSNVAHSDNARKVDALRRELTLVRKNSADAIGGLRETVSALLAKAQSLQSLAALPPPGDSSRSFMERSFKKLTGDADKLLTDVDDLQDVIEDLRKDVAQRGVRPDTRRLETVSADVQSAVRGLESISGYIAAEKAGWKKIWERELDKICEEQQILKFHEEIVVDLKDDLAKAEETFDLVKQCSTEAVKNSSFRQVYLPPPIEGQSVVHAKDAVMNEVVALQPNHERRLEAIERAEKKRKKELQSRGIDTDSFLREMSEEPVPEEMAELDVKPKEKKKKKKSVSGEKKKKKKKKTGEKKKKDDEEEEEEPFSTSSLAPPGVEDEEEEEEEEDDVVKEEPADSESLAADPGSLADVEPSEPTPASNSKPGDFSFHSATSSPRDSVIMPLSTPAKE